VRLDLHWLEHGDPTTGVPFLKLRLPLALAKPEAVYTIPFGAIRHPDRDQETPGIGRVSVLDPAGTGQGLTLFSDCTYGFRLYQGVLEASVVRGSYDPDVYPDLGVHRFEFALWPHAADCREGVIQRRAVDFVHGLATVESYAGGKAQSEGGYLSVSPDSVLLAAVKKPEDSGGLVLRLYETEGRATQAVIALAPALLRGVRDIWLADVHETPLRRLPKPVGKALRVPLKAHDLQTILLRAR